MIRSLTRSGVDPSDLRVGPRTIAQLLGDNKNRYGDATMSLGVIASSFVDSPPVGTEIDLLRHSFAGSNTTTVPAGEVGPVGSELSGDWQVLSNKLRAPGTGEAVYGWDLGGVLSYSYEANLSNSTSGLDPTLNVRQLNAANFVAVRCVVGSVLTIYQRVGGSYALLVTCTGANFANGDLVKVVNTPTKVEAYLNGNLVGTYTGTVNNSYTGVGMRTNGGSVDFDNARAYLVLPAMPTANLYPEFWDGYTGQYNIGGALTPSVRIGQAPLNAYLFVFSLGTNTSGPTSSAGNTFTAVPGGGSSGSSFKIWYKKVEFSDLGSYVSWVQTGAVWGTVGWFIYTGVDQTTPFDATPVISSSGTEVSTWTGSSITTVTPNAMLVHLSSSTSQNGGTVHNITPPTLDVAEHLFLEDNQTHVATSLYDEIQSASGPSTPRTFTNTDTGFLSEIVMALRPAGASLTRSTLGSASYFTGSGMVYTLPAGARVGDFALLAHTSGWFPDVPAGWYQQVNITSASHHMQVSYKWLTSKDIATGTITLTTNSGSDPGSAMLTIVPAKTNAKQNFFAYDGTSTTVNTAGLTERIVTDTDVTISSPGASVAINLEVYWSMNEGGGGKVITWRIRRDNISGAVVASGGGTLNGSGPTADTTNGLNCVFRAGAVDAAPTTGRYVLTLQQNAGGGNTPIYSARRNMYLRTNVAGIRDFAATNAGGGYTSLNYTPGLTTVSGDLAVYMPTQLDVNTNIDVNRGTLVQRGDGAGGSGSLYHETISSGGALGALTFTAGAAGSGSIHAVALIHTG